MCKRPCIVVGGELIPSMLELRLDEASGIYAAPAVVCGSMPEYRVCWASVFAAKQCVLESGLCLRAVFCLRQCFA